MRNRLRFLRSFLSPWNSVKMADGCEDDVPPLEDMSELLQRVGHIREQQNVKNSSSKNNLDPVITQTNHPEKDVGNSAIKNKGMITGTKPEKTGVKKESNGFGGMKKGFLFGSSSSTATQKTEKVICKDRSVTECDRSITECDRSVTECDIPHIKAKSRDDQHVITEVQEAMAAGQNLFQNKEWVTDDLLSKVQNNETLFKRLSEPRFMQAVTEFQTNPQAAMHKYQHNTEVQNFLKEFCGVLGDHFTTVDNSQDTMSSQKSPVVPDRTGADMQEITSDRKSLSDDDQVKMQRILADPEVQQILLDPKIQALIQALKEKPDEAQSCIKTADPDLHRKIRKLMQVGLLQMER